MIPDDKEAISTPTPQPKLPVLDGTALAQSKQRTLHFWQLLITSVRAQVVRRRTPLTAGCSCRAVVIFWQAQKDVWFHRYWPKGGRERGNGGNWAMEMKKRHVAGSTADKGKHVQSLFIPFSLLGCFKKKIIYCFFLIPVKVGAVLTTRALFSLWLFDNGKAVGSYLPKWWPDKGFFSLFFWFFLPKWKKRPRFWWETERENHPPGGSKN